jgi:hypothetical protein
MSRASLSFADAAEAVLREHSKGAPMHYRRITELAISHGLISPGGLTPEASLNAASTHPPRRSSGETQLTESSASERTAEECMGLPRQVIP